VRHGASGSAEQIVKPGARRADAACVNKQQRALERALAESEALHRLVVRNMPGVAIGLYDRDLRCLLLEGQEVERAGIDGSGMRGRHVSEIAGPEHGALLEPAMRTALEGQDGRVELRFGELKTLAVQVAPYREESGEITGVLIVSRDVTGERSAERAQREAEERFRAAFEHAPIGMAIVGLDGRFRAVNDALAEILGRGPDALAEIAPGDLLHPDDRPRAAEALLPIMRGACDSHATELRLVHADGHAVWVNVHVALVRDGDGRALHLLGQLQDITERKRYEERLQHMADHDPLTGLLNRRSFERALSRHAAGIRRYGVTGALLVLDLDGFKHVNDTHGHVAGDELIVSCARALGSRLRATDVLARLGGDEFAVLLPHGGQDEAVDVAQALVDVVRSAGGTERARVTVSVGVADFDDIMVTADEVLVRADRAMYEAKAAGRDGHAVYGRPRRAAA
jgi:diguanylate cyclase (GGDEF)-like protein/PAS domain S-box-containing protein